MAVIDTRKLLSKSYYFFRSVVNLNLLVSSQLSFLGLPWILLRLQRCQFSFCTSLLRCHGTCWLVCFLQSKFLNTQRSFYARDKDTYIIIRILTWGTVIFFISFIWNISDCFSDPCILRFVSSHVDLYILQFFPITFALLGSFLLVTP